MTTFSISVEADENPLSPQEMMDYIVYRLESENVLIVNNIVRDY